MARRRRKSLSRSLGIKKSVSFGPKGSKVNVGTRGVRVTGRNPLTGKRHSKTIMSTSSRRSRGAGCTSALVAGLLVLAGLMSFVAESVSAQTATCDAFDSWIWAQAVFDQDKQTNAALDPDGNGIACEHLPVVGGFAPAIWAEGIPANVTPATVVSITDGDTFKVQLADGTVDTVRMLHIDTPEITGTTGQCGGTQATDFLTYMLGLASNGTVYLESDVTARDRYDRRLAYVWFSVDGDPNPYMANDAMVLNGWAQSETYKPDVKYKAQLDASEAFSVEKVTGVRLLCGTFGQPAGSAGPSDEQIRQAYQKQPNQGQLPPYPDEAVKPTPGGTNEQPTAVVQQPTAVPPPPPLPGDCDPSYPDFCIPPAWQVGDLDCKDVAGRRFTVLPPDGHNFDGDFDGVGCEGG